MEDAMNKEPRKTPVVAPPPKRAYAPPRIATSEATERNALGSSCNPNLDESEGCPKGW